MGQTTDQMNGKKDGRRTSTAGSKEGGGRQ